jgi:6-phosphogluconolactonase
VEAFVNGHGNVRISVFDDLQSLSQSAAELFQSLSQAVIAARGRFAVALSGGTTPRLLYKLLGSVPYLNTIDWRRVYLFWADERCVPSDHPESNYRLVRDTLLENIPLPKRNVHNVQGEADPEEAARAYEQDIKAFYNTVTIPSFDLIILGVGVDGHTASLFPGSSSSLAAARIAIPVYLAEPQVNRVSLTIPVINHASNVLFLVAGRAKAGVLQNILYQGNSKGYPAGQILTENGTVAWFLDREAAGR